MKKISGFAPVAKRQVQILTFGIKEREIRERTLFL